MMICIIIKVLNYLPHLGNSQVEVVLLYLNIDDPVVAVVAMIKAYRKLFCVQKIFIDVVLE